MQKIIDLALNKCPVIPPSLRETPKRTCQKARWRSILRDFTITIISIPGDTPRGIETPAQFEHLNLLTPTAEFRCLGDSFRIGTAFRRSTSNQLGQAFCRWFLHDHLKITYFAHMDATLDQHLNRDLVDTVSTG